MSRKCIAGLLALLVLVFVILSVFFHNLGQKVTLPVLSSERIDPQKIIFLMRYHGAQIARLKDGRWYFLARNGRWLPLETEEACRHLTAQLQRKNASCL